MVAQVCGPFSTFRFDVTKHWLISGETPSNPTNGEEMVWVLSPMTDMHTVRIISARQIVRILMYASHPMNRCVRLKHVTTAGNIILILQVRVLSAT